MVRVGGSSGEIEATNLVFFFLFFLPGNSYTHIHTHKTGTADDLQAILTLKGLARGEVSNMFGPLSANMIIKREHDTATFRHDEHCHECNRLRWTMTKHHCRNCGHKYCTWCITKKVDYVVGNKKMKKEWTCNACLMSTFLNTTHKKRGLKLGVKDLVRFQRDISKKNGDGNVMMVSAGSRHTLFLRLDGKVLWCGRFRADEEYDDEEEIEDIIGRNDSIQHFTSYEIGQAIERDVKRMRMGRVPELVPGFRQTIRQVSAGRGYSVFLDDDGAVYTFGENSEGQLGHGTL